MLLGGSSFSDGAVVMLTRRDAPLEARIASRDPDKENQLHDSTMVVLNPFRALQVVIYCSFT